MNTLFCHIFKAFLIFCPIVNIKERLDFSCAIFDAGGGLVANAPHIPVHLGAMQSAVQFQIQYWNRNGRGGIAEGDVLVSNHPQLAGGSHLPDITVITPVFSSDGVIIFYIASRGHHADIGGIAPGSMPPHSTKLEHEGASIVAFKLVENDQFQEEGITELLIAPGKVPGSSPCRNLPDVLSDLKAQVAANQSGMHNLLELIAECGLLEVSSYMTFIQDNAEECVRSTLKAFSNALATTLSSVEGMDDGSILKLKISIDSECGDATFDFSGTSEQVLMNHNAPPAVTYSATIYCLRCLMDHLPEGAGIGRAVIPCLNQGCLAPIKFILPEGSMLSPSVDAAVVGGNVLTSQRVVDLILKAFQVCAASNGCMNNLTFGDETFGYYETIGGGAGAGPRWHGQSGVHTHCTNTRITDPEILEIRYPVILREFSLRSNSGGKGLHDGGEGIVRTIEPLRPLTMSLLTERRVLRPYGMSGGNEGQSGKNLIFMKESKRWVNVGGRCSTNLNGKGDLLRIETPGGGGWGRPASFDHAAGQEGQTRTSNPFVGYVKGGSLEQYDGNQYTA